MTPHPRPDAIVDVVLMELWRTGGTAGRLRVLGDHMKSFYIRRGQSVQEHGIIDEEPGKHPDGVGHLSEHREGAW